MKKHIAETKVNLEVTEKEVDRLIKNTQFVSQKIFEVLSDKSKEVDPKPLLTLANEQILLLYKLDKVIHNRVMDGESIEEFYKRK